MKSYKTTEIKNRRELFLVESSGEWARISMSSCNLWKTYYVHSNYVEFPVIYHIIVFGQLCNDNF